MLQVTHTRVPEDLAQRFDATARRVVVGDVLSIVKALHPTRTGCCVALWMRVHDPEPHWVLVCVVSIGDFAPDVAAQKFFKYGYLSMEKGFRLSEHDDHIVSFQSRGNEDDPDWTKCRYPGAVRMDCAEVIISTSGFPWEFDEVCGYLIGGAFGWLTRTRVIEGLETSMNHDAATFLRTWGHI